MYTILMNTDKHLVQTSVTTLYQNENLVDKFKFIIPKQYEDIDLSAFVTTLVYTTPSGEEKNEDLQLSAEIYKENWRCAFLPIDSKVTQHAGEVVLRLIFTDDNERILRSGTTAIMIDTVRGAQNSAPSEPDGEETPDNTYTGGFPVIKF